MHLSEEKEAYRARIWPWAFARRMAWGIVRLMKHKHWKPQRQGHFPTLPDEQVKFHRLQKTLEK